MEESGSNDLTIRAPAPAELGRAIYLFRKARLRPQAQVLVAVRSRPVERFVAAIAWWPEGTSGCFQLTCQPGIARAEAAGLLINQAADGARRAGLATLQNAELLADTSEWIEVLKGLGFNHLRSERFFEVGTQQGWTRTMKAFEKYQARIPANWRTDSIRHHGPEKILALIEPFRLMPPGELRDYWRVDSQAGFNLDLSSILFEGDQPIGTLLARKAQNALYIDIRVVRSENPILRALGNILLFHHMAVQRAGNPDVQYLQFRGGATEHRETANLALRMGGRELPARHAFAKTL